MRSNEHHVPLAWHPVDRHELILRGVARAKVTLTAESVLCQDGRLHDPAAIGFAIQIALPHHDEAVHALRVETAGGFYGDLEQVRREFATLRSTGEGQVKMNLEGLDLSVHVCRHEARTETAVEGTFSTLPANVRARQIGNQLLECRGVNTAFQLRFAFLIDPPCLDHLIGQLNAFREHLRLFAPD